MEIRYIDENLKRVSKSNDILYLRFRRYNNYIIPFAILNIGDGEYERVPLAKGEFYTSYPSDPSIIMYEDLDEKFLSRFIRLSNNKLCLLNKEHLDTILYYYPDKTNNVLILGKFTDGSSTVVGVQNRLYFKRCGKTNLENDLIRNGILNGILPETNLTSTLPPIIDHCLDPYVENVGVIESIKQNSKKHHVLVKVKGKNEQ